MVIRRRAPRVCLNVTVCVNNQGVAVPSEAFLIRSPVASVCFRTVSESWEFPSSFTAVDRVQGFSVLIPLLSYVSVLDVLITLHSKYCLYR